MCLSLGLFVGSAGIRISDADMTHISVWTLRHLPVAAENSASMRYVEKSSLLAGLLHFMCLKPDCADLLVIHLCYLDPKSMDQPGAKV